MAKSLGRTKCKLGFVKFRPIQNIPKRSRKRDSQRGKQRSTTGTQSGTETAGSGSGKLSESTEEGCGGGSASDI